MNQPYPIYVNFNLVTGNDGKTTPIPINPNLVISVVAISVPGKMLDNAGQPIAKSAAGLDIGFRIIPVDHTPEEAQAMLEGKESSEIETDV